MKSVCSKSCQAGCFGWTNGLTGQLRKRDVAEVCRVGVHHQLDHRRHQYRHEAGAVGDLGTFFFDERPSLDVLPLDLESGYWGGDVLPKRV